MAYIEMGYILFPNNIKDNRTVEQVTMDYFSFLGISYSDGKYLLDDGSCIECQFDHQNNSDRYYLKLYMHNRVNKAIEIMQKFDDRLLKSDLRKNVNVVKTYDGISSTLCEKLYPKFAAFERKMRQLILLVLTKAFGDKLLDETISIELLKNLQKKAKKNLNIGDVFEYFDLAQMEEYLFGDRIINLHLFFSDNLTKEKIKTMNEDDLRKTIELMRPKSLWASNFSDLGDEKGWKERILSIHDYRNSVAHHKTINLEQYKSVRIKLNRLIKDLDNAIDEIQNRDFSSKNSYEALSNFSDMLELLSSYLSQYDFRPLLESVSAVMKKIVEPMVTEMTPDMTSVVNIPRINLSSITESFKLPSETIEGMKNFANLICSSTAGYSLNLESLDDGSTKKSTSYGGISNIPEEIRSEEHEVVKKAGIIEEEKEE